MDNNWIKIYSTTDIYKAEIYKGILEENDIKVILLNKQDSAYLFGEIEIYVLADNVIKAKRIITLEDKS